MHCRWIALNSMSLIRMPEVVVIIATVIDLLQTVTSLPVMSSGVDTSGRSRSNYEVRKGERSERYVDPRLDTLVSTLETLGILEIGNGTNCFILDNITKDWQPAVDGVSAIQVSLQFRQFRVPDGTRRVAGGGIGWIKSKPKDVNNVVDTDNTCLAVFTRTTVMTSTPVVTLSQGQHSAQGLDESSVTMAVGGGGRNGTAAGENEESKRTTKPKEEEHTGLNRRQILVISTCSTVIGAFFVTAFILRIRNYMKRSKQDKEGTRRHMRTANIPHQRAHHGSLDHFATNENHRRWSQFNPFATDR